MFLRVLEEKKKASLRMHTDLTMLFGHRFTFLVTIMFYSQGRNYRLAFRFEINPISYSKARDGFSLKKTKTKII